LAGMVRIGLGMYVRLCMPLGGVFVYKNDKGRLHDV
jgi:hypothetical protein